MRISLVGVVKAFGAHTVLDHADLTLGPHSRLGLVGRNGAGKTTLLRLLAGLEQPDEGRIDRDPPSLTVGYLPQEHDRRAGETLLAYLARRTGVAEAQAALELHASDWDADAYAAALERFTALGGGDLEARARTLCADLGLSVPLEQETATLSGGEAARAGLAAILLSRFDVLLLDEPTNDLDFDGLDRLERFLDAYAGGLAVVSHDRAFLDRTVTRIAEIDPWTAAVTEFAGGWSDYAEQRDEARRAAWASFEQAQHRRRELTDLLTRRHTEARSLGAGLGDKTGGQDRRATNALRGKVRQAEKLLERNELPDKPFQPWELRLALRSGSQARRPRAPPRRRRRSTRRLRARPARPRPPARRAPRRHRPQRQWQVDAARAPPRRAPARPRAAERSAGRRCSARSSRPERRATRRCSTPSSLPPASRRSTRAPCSRSSGSAPQHVLRPARSLSPGERTRARLAELQARGVNCLVLDEPTNHLDLEAVEELEEALAAYEGTAVVVSHDRRFLERFAPTREMPLQFG